MPIERRQQLDALGFTWKVQKPTPATDEKTALAETAMVRPEELEG